MLLRLAASLGLLAWTSVVAAAPNRDDTFYRRQGYQPVEYDAPHHGPPRAMAFLSAKECEAKCQVVCIPTQMDFEDMVIYHCGKMKPKPKIGSLFDTVRNNPFYFTLAIIGAILVGILALLFFCFCCSYMCRQPTERASRGSSKQALANGDDAEFKESLNYNGFSNGHHAHANGTTTVSNGHSTGHANGHDEYGMKRERDYGGRRMMRGQTTQVVV